MSGKTWKTRIETATVVTQAKHMGHLTNMLRKAVNDLQQSLNSKLQEGETFSSVAAPAVLLTANGEAGLVITVTGSAVVYFIGTNDVKTEAVQRTDQHSTSRNELTADQKETAERELNEVIDAVGAAGGRVRFETANTKTAKAAGSGQIGNRKQTFGITATPTEEAKEPAPAVENKVSPGARVGGRELNLQGIFDD